MGYFLTFLILVSDQAFQISKATHANTYIKVQSKYLGDNNYNNNLIYYFLLKE